MKKLPKVLTLIFVLSFFLLSACNETSFKLQPNQIGYLIPIEGNVNIDKQGDVNLLGGHTTEWFLENVVTGEVVFDPNIYILVFTNIETSSKVWAQEGTNQESVSYRYTINLSGIALYDPAIFLSHGTNLYDYNDQGYYYLAISNTSVANSYAQELCNNMDELIKVLTKDEILNNKDRLIKEATQETSKQFSQFGLGNYKVVFSIDITN